MSPCSVVKLNDGGFAFVKHGAGVRFAVCSVKGCGVLAEYLCDWPRSDRGTCDQRLCRAHALEVAADRHVCPDHRGRPWPPVSRESFL